MDPKLTEVRGGWAAVGQGWAVFASTRDDAVREYVEAEQRHREIAARPTQDRKESGRGPDDAGR